MAVLTLRQNTLIPLTNNEMDDNFIYLQDLANNALSIANNAQTTANTAMSASGVTAGTYNNVTVNTRGIVTGGTNETYANLSSPNFVNIPTAPTAPNGTNTNQIATTAFVTNALAAGTALGTMASQNANAVNITGGTIVGTTINGNVVGANSVGARTVSTAAPSGGSNGDIWLKV